MSKTYHDLAVSAKAFSDPNRLLILESLAQAPCAVEQLSIKVKLALGNLSHHLQILKQTGLVQSRREGRQIVYSISGPQVIIALQALRKLHEHLLEIDQKIESDGFLLNGPRIQRSEALRMIKEGKAVLLDVRPLDEYNAGHIRGAVHIPLEDLEGRLQTLPKHKVIVAYCRGPYCQLSMRANEILSNKGFSAGSLEDGFPEWWAGGNPIDTVD